MVGSGRWPKLGQTLVGASRRPLPVLNVLERHEMDVKQDHYHTSPNMHKLFSPFNSRAAVVVVLESSAGARSILRCAWSADLRASVPVCWSCLVNSTPSLARAAHLHLWPLLIVMAMGIHHHPYFLTVHLRGSRREHGTYVHRTATTEILHRSLLLRFHCTSSLVPKYTCGKRTIGRP